MKIYRAISRARAIEPSHVDEGYWSNTPQTITIYERDGYRDTGLLDHMGNPIVSTEAIAPIGFNRS